MDYLNGFNGLSVLLIIFSIFLLIKPLLTIIVTVLGLTILGFLLLMFPFLRGWFTYEPERPFCDTAGNCDLGSGTADRDPTHDLPSSY